MIRPRPVLDRRTFLIRGSLAAMAGVLAGCGSAAPSVPPSLSNGPPAVGPDLSLPAERGSVGGLDGLHAIGHVWYASHREDGDPDALAAALGVDRVDALRQRLGEFAPRVRDDFAAGRVVTIDGWRLAETEARLATLVWLLEGAPGPS